MPREYGANLGEYTQRDAARMERMLELDETSAFKLTLGEWERHPRSAGEVDRTIGSPVPLA